MMQSMTNTSDETPLCLCGCGERTKGGEFRPGHDARYKAQLLNEAADGRNPEAVQILEQRGWLHFLEKRREVLARPKREPKPSKAEAKLSSLNVLCAMRAAAKVLKYTDQYKSARSNHVALSAGRRKDKLDSVISIIELTHPELDRSNIPESPTLEDRADLFGWLPEELAAVRSLLAPSAEVVVD